MYVYSEIYIYVSRKLVTVVEALAGLGSNCCVTCFCHKIKKNDFFSHFSSPHYSVSSYNLLRYCGGSTPCSSGSVSPGSAALSPPPASPHCATPSATLQEFLNATTHFSNLTLNGNLLIFLSNYFIAFAYLVFHLTYNSAY